MRIFKYFHLLWLFLLTQCVSPPQVAGQFTDQEFDAMANRMATGSVADISVAILQEQPQKFILLDAREQNEYEISHIPNAIWVGYDDFDMTRIKDLARDAQIVTYCSVGYRSERIGEKLQKAGFQNVHNLKGSIFQWINEGNEVVDKNGKATQRVHGFNEKWGRWLKKGKVVY
ncbi:MAG: rhodanese-like domain-containing protein [Saprospiraceae bacterium]